MALKYSVIGLALFSSTVYAHPDTTTPFWYPSAYIYGFITGCSDAVEQNQIPFTQEMWPDQVRSVCGCVVDALRHSFSFVEVAKTDNESMAERQFVITAIMPSCVQQELLNKNYKSDQ